MVEIRVYNDIASANDFFISMFGMEDKIFSAQTANDIFDQNPDETDFKFNIHSNGGSVSEGLAIYDIIRNSGKKIHCNIDGACHSMAITLLLAAPKQNRTANKNCRALIHRVRAASGNDGMTAEEYEEIAAEIRHEENAIIDIYHNRTGTARSKLEKLMKEEKQRTAEELLQYGFISKINAYTTNYQFTNKKNQSKMAKRTTPTLMNRVEKFLSGLKNLLETTNYDFTDADGNVLFSTEREDDTLEVGDAVVIPDGATDGTFDLEDGRTVVVAEGVITEITEPAGGDEEMENLRAENEEFRNQLTEAQNLMHEMKNQIGSKYTTQGRQRSPAAANKGGAAKTAEERKAELREKRNKFTGKGGK